VVSIQKKPDEKEDPMMFETMTHEGGAGYRKNIETSPLLFAFDLVEIAQSQAVDNRYTPQQMDELGCSVIETDSR
jgi:hypothetical protein